MFSPGSLEKNSSAMADTHSQSRSKFSVGLNQLGDESQQNHKIQSAVHRYNNSTVGSFARAVNERSLPSPFRHAFLKNTEKYKNFESDKEEAQNNSKSHNHYQGIGNFPVVHLKKNSVITRPIKRNMSNEFKIQLPELPFNRFLNHSPDICLDTKTSTRSVLDVLQDLSRKRIHTKDDTEATKRKCKGLGGDSPLDIEAPYKPLFVPKPKTNAVTLRDSTTQTQDLPSIELSPAKKNHTILNNKKDDPKAELRRKLARQNNEIFASLSSSTLMYPFKRCSGKLSQDKDDTKQNEQIAKRVKYFSEEKNDKKLQNGDVSSKDLHLPSNRDALSSKTEKKQKAVDSKLSPNKDRLTTIFIEMQNTNPIVEVLTNNQSINSTDNTEPPKTLTAGKSSEERLMSAENKNSETVLDAASKSNNSSPAGLKSDKQNDKITNFFNNNNHSVNNDVSGTDSNSFSSSSITTSGFSISTSTTINFGGSSTSPTFKLPLASTVSSSLTQTPIFSTGISQKGSMSDVKSTGDGINGVNNDQETVRNDAGVVNSEANSPNQKLLFQPSTSGSGPSLTQGVGQQSTDTVQQFKFGIGVTASPSQNTSSEKNTSEETKDGEKNGLGTAVACTASSSNLSGFSSNISKTLVAETPFSMSIATTTVATFSLNQQNPSVFSFTDKSSTSSEITEKPVFQFGLSPTTTSNTIPSSLFGTEVAAPKPEDKPAAEQKTECKDVQNPGLSNANTSVSGFPASTLQNNVFSTSAPSSGQPAVTSTQNVISFKFGEKTETVKSNSDNQLSRTGSNLFDQKKHSLFTFGQKPGTTASETPASQPNPFQQNKFSFGQKSVTPTTTVAQTSTSSSLFGQNPSPQSNIFQQAVVSQASTTANSIINSGSPFGVTTQTSDPLNKSQVPSFAAATTSTAQTGIMNATFSQNKLNASTFGQTTTTNFPSEKNIFGASSSRSSFGSGQPTSTFGDSNKQQPCLTSNFFSQPPATQSSGFPSSTGFGTTAFGQTPSADSNIFSQKSGFDQNQNQSTPFGQGSTAQPFGSQTGFSFGATTTTAASFGFSMTAPTMTTSVFSFGSTTKTTPASTSTFGFSGSAQPEPSQSVFSFNNQPQANAFKFGSTSAKDTPAFGSTGSASSTFSFNSTPSTSEAAKPSASVFNFGTPQTTASNPGFNFGASQTPVFSFGSSAGSSAGGSKFSFGATPSGVGIFTPGATPSPSAVPLQGVFSIGSGSSQPRSRSATARARRRP